jgi:hypothetical protein
VGYSAFSNCINLKSINLPKCLNITNAFNNCSNLQSVNLPACEYIEPYVFQNFSNLQTISLSACSYIGSSAFYGCYNLSEIYLMGSSMCSINGSYVFRSTPFAGYSGGARYFLGIPHIYVPSSLVATYQADAAWGYFSSYFVGI